jgi:hypothetical protein
MMTEERTTTTDSGLAKGRGNVLRRNICGENRHVPQAAKRYHQHS